MNLSIVLVFALHLVGTDSHCNKICRFFNRITRGWGETSREDVMPAQLDNCYCVRKNQCYREDVSTHYECINVAFNYVETKYVCCRRPVPKVFISVRLHAQRPTNRPEAPTHSPTMPSTNIPARTPPSQPTTQAPSLTSAQIPTSNTPTQKAPNTNTDCNCMPLSDCYDEKLKSNHQNKQGSCPTPNDVCCIGLVQQVTTPQPQPPSSSQTSPSTDQDCICTPFFKCYDEETSSNLTGLVNDRGANTNTDVRVAIPNTDESCPDSNDICCYNLVKITAKPILVKSSSKVCPSPGSCVGINDCPYMFNKAQEGQAGNSEAIQELRRSVCSNTNGTIRVCCQPNDSPICKFPFIYKSVTYSECTATDDPAGDLWCSTETDDRNNHVKDQWRSCTSYDILVAAGN